MAVDVLGIHHVAIGVNDLDAAASFYGEVLELEPADRPDVPAPGLWYRIGAQELHIGTRTDLEVGMGHFAIAIAAPEYESYVEAVRQRGAKVVREPRKGPDGLMRTFVEDPSGNRIEITDGPLFHRG